MRRAASALPDPALVAFFGDSAKSYEQNVDDLLQRLDEAAAYTRAWRAARAARPEPLGQPPAVEPVAPLPPSMPPPRAASASPKRPKRA